MDLRKVPKSDEFQYVAPMPARRIEFGSLTLDLQRGSLLRNGSPVAVSSKGVLLLQALVDAAGAPVAKAQLMEAAWPGFAVEESNLSVQIAALRKLLGPQPNGRGWIETIPRLGYRFVGDVQVLDRNDASKPRDTSDALAATDRSSIAVLPLSNVSGDKEQEYLADGLTEDIITALTRFRWFRVIGRNSSFVYKGRSVDSKQVAADLGVQYVLEGSVRRSREHARISIQLVDAASARQIWAERYEMELAEIFAIQDAIAERVAGAIEPELLRTESLPTGPRHNGNVSAWDLVRKGTWHFHYVGRETHFRARELFRQACELDPELAEAHIWLARISAGLVAYGWSESAENDIREGLDAALKAVQLDEKNPYSHYALAISSAYANAPEQAVLAAEKAIEVSPSFALGHLVLGMAQLFRGSASKAVAPLERGLSLSPYDPQNFAWYNLLALAHLFSGALELALAAAIKAQKVRPAWRPTLETLACCYAALGRAHETQSCLLQMKKLEKPAGDTLGPLRLRNPQWAAQINALLEAEKSA
jgi:TolB-like protein/Flp pilus assembly protein TadD